MTTDLRPSFQASRYTTGAIVLHWTIAILVLVQLVGGYAMTDILDQNSPTQFDVYQLHKSFGITILLLTIARILWRLFNPPPPEHPSVSRLERVLAHIVHFLFYALLLIVPLTGWVIITVAPIQLDTVLFFADFLPFPHLPFLASLPDATRHAIEETGEGAHGFLAYTMLALVGLHVAGALKHQFAHRGYIARMTGGGDGAGARRAQGHVVTVLVTLLVFAALVGAAAFSRNGGGTAALPAAPAASTEAPAGTAPAWTVLADESTVSYAFNLDKTAITGTLPEFTVDVRFDEANLGGSMITADITLSSVTVEGRGVSPSQVKGTDGLDIAAQPVARFTTESIEAGDNGGFLARGTLSVRGVEGPVELPFTLTPQENGRVLAEGTATLDRASFGFGKSANESGAKLGPTVDLKLQIMAEPPQDR